MKKRRNKQKQLQTGERKKEHGKRMKAIGKTVEERNDKITDSAQKEGRKKFME